MPNYVPKSNKKFNYRVALLLVVLFAFLGVYVYNHFFTETLPQESGFSICGNSDTKSLELVEARLKTLRDAPTLTMRDYGTYGESLSFYEEPFSYGTNDPMVGKTVTLTNICQPDQQYTFLFGSYLDMRIQLDTLPEGFYDIDILSDLKHYTLISEETVQDAFQTVVRDNRVKDVTLYAKQDLFDSSDQSVLDKNYVFLEIKEVEPDASVYDIVLDPAGGSIQYNGTSDPGHAYRDLIERDEMYAAAVEIKEILERQGLRVLIVRDNITPVNVYGEGGRIHDAYNYKAKYYIQLQLKTSGSSMDRGIMSFFSNSASNRLSAAVVSSLVRSTSLQTTPYDDGENISGVFRTSRYNGFDYNDLVRETGGKFTGAGRADEDFIELQSFAQDFRNGMYGITLTYGYMTDADDYNVWITEKEAIIEATAQGILSYLNINGAE